MIVADEEELLQLGKEFAKKLKRGDIVAIDGTLGAGKTVLCRGILRGLGYDGEVSSPSYAIINGYSPPETAIPVIHADLYRIKDPSELDEIGLFEDAANSLILIEWASMSDNCLKRATSTVSIEILHDGCRRVLIERNH